MVDCTVFKTENCFVTIQLMEPFDTRIHEGESDSSEMILEICASQQLKPGSAFRVQLQNGDEVAIYNIDGEYYAIDNSCPHRGAPLSEGPLCGHVIECGLHGWQFDLRSGECLTVPERLRIYEVYVEAGMIKLKLPE